MPSFSTLRWVKHGHTDHQPITFKDFLFHLRTEKAFTLPRPCLEFPIPGEPFAWESVAHRVGDDPHDPRRAVIEEMIKSGPKKANADGKAPASEEKVVRDQGLWDPFRVLDCHALDLCYVRLIMCLPTPEDKYMVLSQMKNLTPQPELPEWQGRPDAAVMHHIFYFEDLQATGEEVTGYAIKYDFLGSNIIIKKTLGTPRQTTGHTVTSWPGGNRGQDNELFCGTPAMLSKNILTKQPIADDPGFDLILKIIAAEWIVLLADSLQNVKCPRVRAEIFTEDHKGKLAQWLQDEIPGKEYELRYTLADIPFPNRWSRANVNLEDLRAYNPHVADPERYRTEIDGVAYQADSSGVWRPAEHFIPGELEGW